jgi:23S rRNA (guanosine2251-2'-O)-methyltransferase
MKKIQIILIIHNIRSTHNVGSLMRSADGFGVKHIYLTGYTPYPKKENDQRLPHIYEKMTKQINKTALGAENNISWSQSEDIADVLIAVKKMGYLMSALEQTETAQNLSSFKASQNIALIVGSEIGGIDKRLLNFADIHLQIPMRGKKESFNVAVAGAIALYQLSRL